MIDSVGVTDRVNNMLTTLNVKPINHKKLKILKHRAGESMEAADISTRQAQEDSIAMEMW